MKRTHGILVAAVAAVVVLGGATPAAGYGYAPNPGFETNCSGAPCDWIVGGNTAITRDTSVDHTGQASLRVAYTVAGPGDVHAACVSGVAPGSYTVSGWQRSSTAGVGIDVRAYFYPTSTCSGSPSGTLNAVGVTSGDTAWHPLEAAGTAGAGTQSVRISLIFSCPSCGPSAIVNLDDVSLISNLAPNPGFEANCASAPCDWTVSSAAWDHAFIHSDLASVRLTLSDPSAIAQANTCVSGISPGSYTLSAWYRTLTAGVIAVARVVFYPTTNCFTSTLGQVDARDTSTGDSDWHPVEGAVSADPGTQSARISLFIQCTGCAAGTFVNFDDLSLVKSIAPNPGFEADCSGVPCEWTTTSNATATRETSLRHSPQASIGVAYTNPSAGTANVLATCVAGIPAGSYTVSGFYRTTTANVLPDVAAAFFPMSNCTGSGTAVHALEISAGDTAWHLLEGAISAPAGTQSVRLSLTLSCAGCAAGTKVNFDDVTLAGGAPPAPPTAAVLSTFRATPLARGIELRWKTASEAGVAAFRLWRNGQQLAQIAAHGTVHGAAYRYVDRTAVAARPFTYRLEVVGLDGRSTWSVRARDPTTVVQGADVFAPARARGTDVVRGRFVLRNVPRIDGTSAAAAPSPSAVRAASWTQSRASAPYTRGREGRGDRTAGRGRLPRGRGTGRGAGRRSGSEPARWRVPDRPRAVRR